MQVTPQKETRKKGNPPPPSSYFLPAGLSSASTVLYCTTVGIAPARTLAEKGASLAHYLLRTYERGVTKDGPWGGRVSYE